MDEERSKIIAKQCYRPAETMASILSDALHLESEADMIEKEIVAGGGRITKSITAKQEEWKQKKRNLDKRKVNILDNVLFPSMANLTVLVEAMANSGFIEHMFEEDVKSLFFSKSKSVSVESKSPEDRYKASRAIFARFVNASCSLMIHKPENGVYIELDESRAILCNMMLEAVNNALFNIGLKGIGQLKFGDDDEFLHKTLYSDLDRVRSWTRLFAWEANKQLAFDEDKRPALF